MGITVGVAGAVLAVAAIICLYRAFDYGPVWPLVLLAPACIAAMVWSAYLCVEVDSEWRVEEVLELEALRLDSGLRGSVHGWLLGFSGSVGSVTYYQWLGHAPGDDWLHLQREPAGKVEVRESEERPTAVLVRRWSVARDGRKRMTMDTVWRVTVPPGSVVYRISVDLEDAGG